MWIIATLAAAAVQALRLALQRRLKAAGLSTGGATFARFLWAAPLAWAGALWACGGGIPGLGPGFWLWAMIGGLAQIVATFAIITLFSLRNFAVGVAFTKTETLLVVLFSMLVLGESVSLPGMAAILLGVFAVLLLSWPKEGLRGAWISPAMGWGLVAGALFGLSSIGYRAATLAVESDQALLRALMALAVATTFQTLALGGWLALRERGEIGRVLRAWRATLPVGVTGFAGSAGWFLAFALQNAAYVRSLGQIDLLFSLLISTLWFKERSGRQELLGMALLVVSVIGIILVA